MMMPATQQDPAQIHLAILSVTIPLYQDMLNTIFWLG